MKIIQLYSGNDQKSYFKEMDLTIKNQKELGRYSEKYPVTGMRFRESEVGEIFSWHTAPQPQYIIYLDGEVLVEASGGETRIFKAGDILFATDLTGKGHISRVLTKGRAIVVTI